MRFNTTQQPNHHLPVMAGEILLAPFSGEWSQTLLEREAFPELETHRSCSYLLGKEAVGVVGGGQGLQNPTCASAFQLQSRSNTSSGYSEHSGVVCTGKCCMVI